MDIAYCIRCERYAERLSSEVHLKFTHNAGEPVEVDWCEGPFASCSPQEGMYDEHEWSISDEPDEDEMIRINEEAENLLINMY